MILHNEQERDTDRLIAYQFQMARERGEYNAGRGETMREHYQWCPGCSGCFPESIERESDI